MNRSILKGPDPTGRSLPPGGAFAQARNSSGAHVYETSEPHHTESVWAAQEIKKRSNGKFDIRSSRPHARQGDRHQPGHDAGHGRHDHQRPVVRRAQYPRLGIAYYPFIFRDADHLAAYQQEPVFGDGRRLRAKTGIQITAYTYYGARHTTRRSPSPTAPA